MTAAFAETAGGAGSTAFAGGAGVGAGPAGGAVGRVRSGAGRGGGGGGNVAVPATGEERTAFVSTSGVGPLACRLALDASIQARSLTTSSSSRLASADPLP